MSRCSKQYRRATLFVVLAAFFLALLPMQASAETRYGKITYEDMYKWCMARYNPVPSPDISGLLQVKAAAFTDDPHSWKCVITESFDFGPWFGQVVYRVELHDVDMNDICRHKRGSRTYAYATNRNNPNSWVCVIEEDDTVA